MDPPVRLRAFIARLQQAEVVPRPPNEEWGALIARIHINGSITEIDQETFDWFLECLPPKYQSGSLFAFAEGAEALRIFWKRDGRYFCRPLTWEETKQFCSLARIELPW